MNFLSRLTGVEAEDSASRSGEGAAAGGENGGGGWLAALKEKSKELAEVYKRDIGVCLRCLAGGLLEGNAPWLLCRRAGPRGRRQATLLAGRCDVHPSSRRLHPAAGAEKAAPAARAARGMRPAARACRAGPVLLTCLHLSLRALLMLAPFLCVPARPAALGSLCLSTLAHSSQPNFRPSSRRIPPWLPGICWRRQEPPWSRTSARLPKSPCLLRGLCYAADGTASHSLFCPSSNLALGQCRAALPLPACRA
jgi:hypothetical protein